MARAKKYTAIEFDIYEALDWDRDKIILALDVIRKKFCEKEQGRYGLSAHIMPRAMAEKDGEMYPVMGLVIPTTQHFGYFDTHSITSLFDAWRREYEVVDLLSETNGIGVPSWEKLLEQETFPIDPRTL